MGNSLRVLEPQPKSTGEASPADARSVADYIVGEMLKNSSRENADFARISAEWEKFRGLGHSPPDAPGLRIIALFEALDDFIRMVGYRAPWDHKSRIGRMFGRVSLLKGAELPSDVWSNIHYGFIGTAIGFPSDLLLRAAGFASLHPKGTVSRDWISRWLDKGEALFASLDDARDQEAIKIGFTAFLQFNLRLTANDLLTLLGPRLGLLIESN
jgi:hypothetical protein